MQRNFPLAHAMTVHDFFLFVIFFCLPFPVVTKDLRKGSTDIWVSLNPDYVCTRFFFVYDDPSLLGLKKGANSTSTTCPEFRQEIDHAMEYIKAVKAIT